MSTYRLSRKVNMNENRAGLDFTHAGLVNKILKRAVDNSQKSRQSHWLNTLTVSRSLTFTCDCFQYRERSGKQLFCPYQPSHLSSGIIVLGKKSSWLIDRVSFWIKHTLDMNKDVSITCFDFLLSNFGGCIPRILLLLLLWVSVLWIFRSVSWSHCTSTTWFRWQSWMSLKNDRRNLKVIR